MLPHKCADEGFNYSKKTMAAASRFFLVRFGSKPRSGETPYVSRRNQQEG
jgi:hypothetical protein